MAEEYRIAIYARYSTDLQNPASLADQVYVCRKLIEQHFPGAEIVGVYEDAAISGVTMERPGLLDLLDRILNGELDVVVSEGLDRISRNLSDMARIFNLCSNERVRIYTAHEGEVGEVHVGFKGTMNALFLRDMRDKVRRAHKSRAASGRAPASVSFGYRVLRGVLDDRGNYINGLRTIHEPEAEVVRRIFTALADGIPARSVMKLLNDEGVPAPSGGRWGLTSILGTPGRGTGILQNELYRGELVYNRTRKVTDPQTGRSRYVVNPQAEWIRTPVPELRIIDDELWERAHASRRRNKPAERAKPGRRHSKVPHEPRGIAYALTGLVFCGACGGLKSLAQKGRYVCENNRRSKTCTNARGTTTQALGDRLFVRLIGSLHEEKNLRAQILALIETKLQEERARRRKIDQLNKRMTHLLDLVEQGAPSKSAAQRIAAIQAEIDDLLDYPPVPNIDLSERAIKKRMAEALTVISATLLDRRMAVPVRQSLAELVENIVLTPIPHERRGEDVEIKLRPGGWASFYVYLHSAWPGGGEAKLGRPEPKAAA